MSNSCPNCTELEAQVARLSVDSLTGLAGRGVFDRALKTEFARARRFHRDIGIIMIDVDHFKSINDEYGHVVGDQVLHSIAQRIRKHVRDCDVVARYGGEEFVILTDGATHEGLEVISERVRATIELAQSDIQATVSVGFAVQNTFDAEGRSVVERADAALYEAKNAGRNCVKGDCHARTSS